MEKTSKRTGAGTPMEHYEAFAGLVLQDWGSRPEAVSFGQLCRWAEAPRREIDCILRHELGMGGRALVRELKRGYFNKKDPFYCD